MAGASVTACIVEKRVSKGVPSRECGTVRTVYLTMTQELIKLLSSKGLAFATQLGIQGLYPHLAVSRVLKHSRVAMIRRVVAELLECHAKRLQRSVSLQPRRVKLQGKKPGYNLQFVPVLESPSTSTLMGTTRWHFRRSMSVTALGTKGRSCATGPSSICWYWCERIFADV